MEPFRIGRCPVFLPQREVRHPWLHQALVLRVLGDETQGGGPSLFPVKLDLPALLLLVANPISKCSPPAEFA